MGGKARAKAEKAQQAKETVHSSADGMFRKLCECVQLTYGNNRCR